MELHATEWYTAGVSAEWPKQLPSCWHYVYNIVTWTPEGQHCYIYRVMNYLVTSLLSWKISRYTYTCHTPFYLIHVIYWTLLLAFLLYYTLVIYDWQIQRTSYQTMGADNMVHSCSGQKKHLRSALPYWCEFLLNTAGQSKLNKREQSCNGSNNINTKTTRRRRKQRMSNGHERDGVPNKKAKNISPNGRRITHT